MRPPILPPPRRRTLHALLALGCGPALQTGARAQPAGRPLKIVVAYPPGGAADTVARALAPVLSQQLGVPVIVENRAGASGTLGIDAVARAEPDGLTLGFAALSPVTLSPHVQKVPYDPLGDLAPVASVMYSPVWLLATPAFAGRSLRDVAEQAKARPGALRWATSGVASIGHLMLEQVRDRAGVEITHVPYKGGNQAVADAVSGQFELYTANPNAALLAQVERGTLRPVAVGAPRRLEAWPQVATFAEQGFPEANLASTFGLFAPGRTPADTVRRLHDEIDRALARPDLRERMTKADNVPAPMTLAAFGQLVRSEHEANARIVRAAGLKADQ